MSQPPLPAETGYWRCGAERQRVVNALFDRSADHYDCACSLMSLGLGQSYRRQALERAGLGRAMRVLDVGAGTGLLSREIAHVIGPNGSLVAVDPSSGMIASGRKALAISFVQALGERLPFADAQFDFVTMGYALRHVPDLDVAFAEYGRVLKPGGRLLLLEITRPHSPVGRAVARSYFGTLVPFVTLVGTGSTDTARLMRFFWDTIAQCVQPETVLASMRRAQLAAPTRAVVRGIFSEYTATRAA